MKLKDVNITSIKKLKEEHRKQDEVELFGSTDARYTKPEAVDCKENGFSNVSENKSAAAEPVGITEPCGTSKNKLEEIDGGALWDIFRREDVSKLEEYLKKHYREFRHIYGCPVQQASVPLKGKMTIHS